MPFLYIYIYLLTFFLDAFSYSVCSRSSCDLMISTAELFATLDIAIVQDLKLLHKKSHSFMLMPSPPIHVRGITFSGRLCVSASVRPCIKFVSTHWWIQVIIIIAIIIKRRFIRRRNMSGDITRAPYRQKGQRRSRQLN